MESFNHIIRGTEPNIWISPDILPFCSKCWCHWPCCDNKEIIAKWRKRQWWRRWNSAHAQRGCKTFQRNSKCTWQGVNPRHSNLAEASRQQLKPHRPIFQRIFRDEEIQQRESNSVSTEKKFHNQSGGSTTRCNVSTWTYNLHSFARH